jgi:hypothetical protein
MGNYPMTRFRLPDLPEKQSPRPCGRGLESYGLTSYPDRHK